MSANNLLLWLSARREGSWPQFRGAVEEFHLQAPGQSDGANGGGGATRERALPVYQECRFGLERLGHLEFGSHSDLRWRVVPPALALLSGSDDAVGVLCGARSPHIVDDLATLSGVDIDVCEAGGMPDRILLRAASEERLKAAARLAGFYVQHACPPTLLAALPSIRERRGWAVSELPATPGWTIHRFSSSQLRWTEVGLDATSAKLGTGLFRFAMKHQRFYYVLSKGRCFRVPVQVGKYAVVRRRRDIMRYDSRTRVMSVPPVCRPPLLVERALVLCSGLLPKFDGSGRLAYPDVAQEVARLAGQILCQDLG